MKRRLFSAVILSLAIASTNCVYAETVVDNSILNAKQSQTSEIVTDENVSVENQGQDHLEQTNPEQANPEGEPIKPVDPYVEEGETEGNNQIPPHITDEEETTPGTTDKDLLNKVILTLNSKIAIVEGEAVELLTSPVVINDTTLLPLRFVADQVVGANVDWNKETQTVTITKDGTEVIVTIGSKIAKIDGLELELMVAPIIDNNTTLVPLRFISEAFNIGVDYNGETKTITLDKGSQVQVPNQAPIASFYFPESYVAGQTVTAINTSTDPDGDAITEQLWSILSGDKTLTNKELSNMFKTPKAGTYVIGLQVKDSKGLWSEWSYQTVTIEENKAPVITNLTANKSSYAQGEPLEFSYTYDNESWETVKEGKWTYRSVSEPANRNTLGKPDVLFTEGEYIITLYLDDAYGNRSEGVETRVQITDKVLTTELNYRFTQGAIGDWIDNFQNNNYLNYKEVTIDNKSYKEGTLIMSDSPEEVKGQGILYRDKINGSGRILIHHINSIKDTTETQRLALIVENPTEKPVTVKLMNKSIKGPATDILRVGQLTLNEYLSGTVATETIVLAPGERKYIYDKNWAYNTCISGHMDVETDGDATFIVANLGKMHTLEDLESLTYYPADGVHYSGTYGVVGINYELNLDGSEPEKLVLGRKDSGEWVTGYDERTNTIVENAGNFGVSYYITVTAQEDMGVILNNRGGTFQGAIKWNNTVHNMPGKGTFSGTTTKAVVMGVIKKGETVTIEYLLPNGSAAPTLIGFIPKSAW